MEQLLTLMTMLSTTNRIYPFLFLNLGACFSVLPLASAQSSLIDRVQKAENSIVAIEAQKAGSGQSGAGVVIDPDGYIVTNTHTILDAQFIFVTLHDGTQLPASISSIAPDSDFTILKINPPSTLQSLPWADSHSGGKINSIGRPRSGAGQTVEVLGMDLNLDHGDSGGPVLDRNGNFLGIIVAKNIRMDRASFAIPSNKIREHFLKYINENQR